MKAPAFPPNEAARLAALRDLEILDTPPEERFDRITRIAQRHFGVQMALVSLVDAGRQWFKSRQGLDASETPRDISFCGHAILGDDVFHVSDARNDSRFADNPLVCGGPEIRFYAAAPLRAPGGERVGTLCIIDRAPRKLDAEDLAMLRDLRDLAEAELGQAELREAGMQTRAAQNRLRAVIDTVVDGIITIDSRGIMHTYNPAAERIFGYAAAEAVGRNVSMLMPEPYHGAHDGYLHNYVTTGQRKIIGIGREVTGRRKDGSTFPMDLAVSEMQIKGERMFTGIVRDITERKEAELALRESQAKLSGLYELSPLGIALAGMNGGFLEFNEAFRAICGYPAEELKNLDYWTLTPKEYEEQEAAQLESLGKTGRYGPYEKTYRRKDGRLIPIRLNGILVEDQAGQPHIWSIVEDITDSKQAEQELIAASNAAALANRAKDAFLATMSHEIRTPLAGLLGMLELLSLSPLNSEQAETLATARDSGTSLLRIVNDILDWSKIEEGKLELAPQATSLAQLAAGVANTYSHVASGNSVMLLQQVDARISPALLVDALRLAQVLNNFVSNAIKFSHGGRVELRAELIESLGGAERVRFSVKDTGIGIDAEAQQRLFQIYNQGGADTARMYGGTGLGLAICRRLADLLDARIEVQSAPGRGSTFSITLTLALAEAAPAENRDLFQHTVPLKLPAARRAKGGERDLLADTIPLTVPAAQSAAATPAQASATATATAGAPLVLVVDDHPINRRLLALQLELLGFRARTAEHGQAGLALWRDERYALVMTDCHMPVMDGYALARAIREIEAAEAREHTPIFAWTANALPDEIENCRAAGMDELLVKPADLAQLKQALARWLPLPAQSTPQSGGAPAAPAGQKPAVDVSVLESLVGDDAAVVREFLQDFRESTAAIVASLPSALLQGRAKDAAAAAHKLKSSARSVGAFKLGDLCNEIERVGNGGDSQSLADLLPGFEQELLAVEQYLNSYMTCPKSTRR